MSGNAIAQAILEKKRADMEKMAELERENEQLREKLASYELQEAAEQLMFRAMEMDTDMVSGLAPATVGEFIAKRAELAECGFEVLEKEAGLLKYAAARASDKGGFRGPRVLSDEDEFAGITSDYGRDDDDILALIEGRGFMR